MKRMQWLGVLAVAILPAACSSANVEQEKTALLAADREWSASTKDVDKFVAAVAPDGTIYGPNMPKVTGMAAIKDAFGPMLSAPGTSVEWTPARADVGAGGDVGYTVGSYKATMKNAAGIPATEVGKYVTVWKKQSDGKWKVAEDIFNADAPAPPSSAHVMVAGGS